MASAQKQESSSVVTRPFRSPSLPLLLTLATVAIGGAALLPLIQSSLATSTNGNLQQLEQQHADLQVRLHELEMEVATTGALDHIEKEAIGRLKMAPPKNTVYIPVPIAEPEPYHLPSRFLPRPENSKSQNGSWWDKLFDWMPLP